MIDRYITISNLETNIRWIEDIPSHQFPGWGNVTMAMLDAMELLKEQDWVRCSDRMPEEHDSIFAKLKGTDKWSSAMCEKLSDDVRIVEVFEDGTRRVHHSRTIDGKWDIEGKPIKRTVTHWMPNPELPLEGW